MDAVTYSDSRVIDFLSRRMIPLRVAWNAEPLASDFDVHWTPTLITLDPDGREHHRTVGYLPPEDLIPSLLLGIAKWHFDAAQYDPALEGLEEVVSKYPEGDAAPEALYLSGVARYKRTGDAKYLKEVQRELAARYMGSVWEKRASVYQKLPDAA